jgi:hypothetical protein
VIGIFVAFGTCNVVNGAIGCKEKTCGTLYTAFFKVTAWAASRGAMESIT